MDLTCSNKVLWGQQIQVGKTLYTVDKDGRCADVEERHAELLRQNKSWSSIEGAVDLLPEKGQHRIELISDPAKENKKELEPESTTDEIKELMRLPKKKLISSARKLGISVIGKSTEDVARLIVKRAAETDA